MASKKKSTPQLSPSPRTVLPGSEKAPFVQTAGEKPAPSTARFTVSVVVKRKTPLKAANRTGKQRLTHAQYKKNHGADPNAVKLVRAFAKEFGLAVAPDTPGPERRTVKLTGTVAAMQKAFGVTLLHKTHEGTTYRVREGSITLPAELVGPVEAVLGLDNRPQAKPHFRIAGEAGDLTAKTAQAGGFAKPHASGTSTSYTPIQVGQLYQFPAGATATGQTIGIIELGGGYKTADLTTYFKALGQKAPKVTTVSVDGGKNSPTNANSADGEVMLDIEVAAAVAPGANIVVYFTSNTSQGFQDALSTAIHDTTNNPSVISISWGGPESSWTSQFLTSFDQVAQEGAALGVTITVAAGDDGSSDGADDGSNNVDFPASSPNVLACGGTSLVSTNGVISSETVWNDGSEGGATGGGFSTVFAQPAYQSSLATSYPGQTGRGVPDVASVADPDTGYNILVDGSQEVVGGTSAAAPLWAGLIALLNQQLNTRLGLINTAIYALPEPNNGFNDITEGNNGSYSAGPGWDPCTGLGSPIGTTLATLLATPPASS